MSNSGTRSPLFETGLSRLALKGERFIADADLSAKSVVRATKEALAQSRHGNVQARDVALVLLPEAAPADAPARQMLIARVGMKMRELVAVGKLERVADPAGRRTARYALPRRSGDDG